MLVNASEMLKKAKAGHYAVGQFNINNLEWTKAILLTAQELNSPVILGVSEGAGKYMTGYKTVVGMVKGMLEELNITVPVALHLDHGSYEGCLKCVEAGFTSIMFDGSHYPIEENVEKTKELVKIVAEHGMSLEAEVGSIGGEEDGVVGMGECADPQECKMVADLGIDFPVRVEESALQAEGSSPRECKHSCDIPFFYIQKQNIKGSHSMRLAKSGSFSYAQRVMTCATMVSPS